MDNVGISTVLSSVLYAGLLLCFLIYCKKLGRLYYYGFKINGPWGIPFIGCVHLFIKGRDAYIDQILELCQKYKPLLKVWLGPYLFIVVTNPDDVGFLLKHCLEKGQQYDFLKPAFGEGVATAPVTKWKVNRKIINRMFNQDSLNSYMNVFVKYSNKLVEDLKSVLNIEFDIMNKLNEHSFAIIYEICMGENSSASVERRQYIQSLAKGATIIGNRFFSILHQFDFFWKFSSQAKELESLRPTVNGYVRKLVQRKRHEAFDNNVPNSPVTKTFLNYLIQITKEEDKWTDEHLMEEAQTMMMNGSDTVARAVSFTLVMIGLHPQFQEKIFDELTSIFGNNDRDVTLKDLEQMEYLERVIKETMRLYPIAPVILRTIHEDVVVDSHLLPKGGTLLFPIVFLHRDPDFWIDPLRFDPDRFLPEEIAKRPRNVYLPFSLGPRNCVGMKFAMMSMKVTLSTILRQLKVISTQYKSVSEIKINLDIIATAAKGYGVTLTSRLYQ